jgi:hypothetical protein
MISKTDENSNDVNHGLWVMLWLTGIISISSLGLALYSLYIVPAQVKEYVSVHKLELKGDTGQVGPEGIQGSMGPAGASGLNGASGSNGINGTDAFIPTSCSVHSLSGPPPSYCP